QLHPPLTGPPRRGRGRLHAVQPVTIANAALEVRVATDSGPRITHLGRPTTEGSAAERNVLLVQDGVRLQPVEDGPAVTLRGGHRLWVAPETLELTYLPDDGPVDVTADDTTVVATATGGGIGKRLEVTLDGTVVRIRHQLTNATGRPQRIAAWGITQDRKGTRLNSSHVKRSYA